MKWTDKKPTEPGFYGVRDNDGRVSVLRLLFVDADGVRWWRNAAWCSPFSMTWDTHYCGPIALPTFAAMEPVAVVR